jgi:hypothetical protein
LNSHGAQHVKQLSPRFHQCYEALPFRELIAHFAQWLIHEVTCGVSGSLSHNDNHGKGVPLRLFVGEFAPFDAILCGGSSDEFDQNAQNCPLTS